MLVCLFFICSNVAVMFFTPFMLLLSTVQLSTAFPRLSVCQSIIETWKPQLSLLPEAANNRTLVRYKEPDVGNISQTVESLTFYLLRSDVDFSCNLSMDKQKQLTYKILKLGKEEFCARTICDFYFENLSAGYYCIKMEMNLSNDEKNHYSGQFCNTVYSNDTINISHQNESTTFVNVRDRRPSHKAKVWIVVSTLVVIGVVLAFALERTYKRRRRRYARVAVTESNNLHLVENVNVSGHVLLAREVTGRLVFLYTNDSEVHFLLVKQFVDLLRETLPNWEFILDREHVNDICTFGTVRWVEETIRKVDRVVLISSEGAYRQMSFNPSFDAHVGNGDINYVFAVAWNFMLNDPVLRGNYTKVFNIRFECTRPEFTLTSVVPGRHFLLPTNYVELVNHILGCNSWADAFCKDLKGNLRHSRPYLLFVDAVERLARDAGLSQVLGSQDFCWVKPGV